MTAEINIETKYMFEIHSSVTAKPLGEVPDGFRIDLSLSDAAVVKTDEERLMRDWPKPSRLEPDWKGLSGTLVSGGDWVTVYNNGVVRLNGRATINVAPKPLDGTEPQAGQDNSPFLIDMFYAGIIDLLDVDHQTWSSKQEKNTYDSWRAGRLGGGSHEAVTIAVALGVNFELAESSQPWAQKQFQSQVYAKYARLARAQFVAIGNAQLEALPYSPISSLDLTLYQTRIRSPAR